MTIGGIFQLNINDGKQDKLLLATDILNSRLRSIKHKLGRLPNLTDIERTHVILTHNTFKPFVSVAYEYNKIPGPGDIDFGETVKFQLPQFGDFVNDMYLHVGIRQINHSVPNETTKVRYFSYPGERLMKNVKFHINGNLLDEYNSDTYVMHRNFSIKSGQKELYNECMGQDLIKTVQSGEQLLSVPKTKYQSDDNAITQDLDLYIPLLFWFNQDVSQSFPLCKIANGQTFIEIDICEQNEFMTATEGQLKESQRSGSEQTIHTIDLYTKTLFIDKQVQAIYSKSIGFNLIRTHFQRKELLNKPSDSIKLDSLKFPVEYMQVGFRPYSYLDDKDKWYSFDLHLPSSNEITTSGIATVQMREHSHGIPNAKLVQYYDQRTDTLSTTEYAYLYPSNFTRPGEISGNMFDENAHTNYSVNKMMINQSSFWDTNHWLNYIKTNLTTKTSSLDRTSSNDPAFKSGNLIIPNVPIALSQITDTSEPATNQYGTIERYLTYKKRTSSTDSVPYAPVLGDKVWTSKYHNYAVVSVKAQLNRDLSKRQNALAYLIKREGETWHKCGVFQLDNNVFEIEYVGITDDLVTMSVASFADAPNDVRGRMFLYTFNIEESYPIKPIRIDDWRGGSKTQADEIGQQWGYETAFRTANDGDAQNSVENRQTFNLVGNVLGLVKYPKVIGTKDKMIIVSNTIVSPGTDTEAYGGMPNMIIMEPNTQNYGCPRTNNPDIQDSNMKDFVKNKSLKNVRCSLLGMSMAVNDTHLYVHNNYHPRIIDIGGELEQNTTLTDLITLYQVPLKSDGTPGTPVEITSFNTNLTSTKNLNDNYHPQFTQMKCNNDYVVLMAAGFSINRSNSINSSINDLFYVHDIKNDVRITLPEDINAAPIDHSFVLIDNHLILTNQTQHVQAIDLTSPLSTPLQSSYPTLLDVYDKISLKGYSETTGDLFMLRSHSNESFPLKGIDSFGFENYSDSANSNAIVTERVQESCLSVVDLPRWHTYVRLNNLHTGKKDEVLTRMDSDSKTLGNNQLISQKMVDKLSLKSNEIEFYKPMTTRFYNSYVPFQYCEAIPDDEGLYLFNFCLTPGQYQPSGSINLSRLSEMYLNYESSYIKSGQESELLIEASVLNFLLLSNGSANLRYLR